jgi:hypothetical protein
MGRVGIETVLSPREPERQRLADAIARRLRDAQEQDR